MDSRKRVQTALAHQEADRIPVDLGATVMTSLHAAAYQNLRHHLGFAEIPITIADTVQQLVVVDDDVREWFGVDTRGFRAGRSKKAAEVVIEKDRPDQYTFHDEWGIGWKMPMPHGFYYDVYHHPLQDPDLTIRDIETYPFPDPTDPGRFVGLREVVERAAKVEKTATVMGGICAGFIEMAGWMRGYSEYMIDLIDNPALMEAFFDQILRIKMAFWDVMLRELGDSIDVILESDDLGSQTDLLISPQIYRRLVKPRHKQLFSFIKSRTNAKILFHSCGAIRKVLPDLIDVGVDILNPLQVSATGMDSSEIKRDFGKDLTFWGGGVETQRILGDGTPEEVKTDVRRRIEDLASGGGFVFGTVHAIQANVPPANVAAIREALDEYGLYSPM